MLRRLINDTTGASAIEYSVIAALVSVAGIAAFLLLGQETNRKFAAVDAAYAQAK